MKSVNKRGIIAEKNRLLNGKKLERSKEKLYTYDEIEYAANILNADELLIKKMCKQFDVQQKRQS